MQLYLIGFTSSLDIQSIMFSKRIPQFTLQCAVYFVGLQINVLELLRLEVRIKYSNCIVVLQFSEIDLGSIFAMVSQNMMYN